MSYQQYREHRRGKGNEEYMSSYQKRQAWTPEEDEILKQQVARLGTHCWPDVAGGLTGRTSKACSLRWRCFLSPTIIRPNEEPFSQWEIAVIVLTQKMFGNKWNDIANYLPMRCNNDIKNHFNLYLKDKQQQVSVENSYLRAGYDLPTLLANEPEEVQQRREKLEKERASSNNFDHAPIKSTRSSLSYLRRPPGPKPKPVPKYHPYHLPGSGLRAAQPGGGLTSMTRSGSGPSLGAVAEAASPSAQQHHTYSGFASLPRPHSSQSMGSMDALAMGPGLSASMAAAGLPSSLLYGAIGSHFTPPAVSGQFTMLPDQLLRSSSVKQELLEPMAAAAGTHSGEGNMCGGYSSNAYTTGYSMPGGQAGDWQQAGSGASPAIHLAAGGCEEGVVARRPSRLQHTGHPELADVVAHGSSGMSSSGQQQQHPMQQVAGGPAFESMPSLPEPAEPGILEGGDGDGTSLRGIFSSDDGEIPLTQQQGLAAAALPHDVLQQQGSGSQQHGLAACPGGIDLAAAAAALAQQPQGSPTGAQLCPAYASPGSYTSGCSPMPLPRFQQQQHGTAGRSIAASAAGQLRTKQLHLDLECGVINTAYDTHLVAGGDRGALSAPCTVTAAYTPNGYSRQQQQQQPVLPQGAFTQGGQDLQQQSYMQQQQQQSQQQSQQQQGRYTPFGHPEHQQQQVQHMGKDQQCPPEDCMAAAAQQQLLGHQAAYQAAAFGVDAYDSGNSSHHYQQPGTGFNSPSTVAASAVAAVARGCALAGAPQSWGSSPTSAPQQHQAHHHQAAAGLLPHHLTGAVASDDVAAELGPLAELLDHAGDHKGGVCGDGDAGRHHHGGLEEGGDCELMLSEGDFDDHVPVDMLTGLKRQNSELEMMAVATCW